MKKKVIYKTIITLVVLSEEPIPETASLGNIIDECDTGEYIMGAMDTAITELSGKNAVNEIVKTGSDPEFFQIDGEGYPIIEHDYYSGVS